MIEWIKKYIIYMLFALVFLFIIIFSTDDPAVTLHEIESNSSDLSSESEVDLSSEPIKDKVLVDIKGAVYQPGVYSLTNDARVNDIIQLAGGFLESADQTQINLAQKVYDEMVIIVPEKGDQLGEGLGSFNGKIRINIATKEEIETLTGIGPSKAEAIIQYREENGRFQSEEELLEVSGIGQKTLETIKEEILVP